LQQSLEQSAGDRWESWVGVWRGLRTSPGASGKLETKVFVPWAAFTTIELPYRCRGFVVRPTDHLRLELAGEVTPASTGNAVTRALANALVGDTDKMAARFERVAILDPRTMLPLHAESRRRLRNETSQGPREAVEIRVWDFTWETPTAPR
jgi:hypothetical protein